MTYAAEQGCEGWICLGLAFDVRDDVFAVETEELFDWAAGEASPGGRGSIEGPDGEDELPCFYGVFADEVVGLLERPEERVVFGSVLRRLLEGDPGFCQLVALVSGHEVTSR